MPDDNEAALAANDLAVWCRDWPDEAAGLILRMRPVVDAAVARDRSWSPAEGEYDWRCDNALTAAVEAYTGYPND